MRILLVLLVVALCSLAPSTGQAQTASLLADKVVINGDTTIIASGNVEILVDGIRLTASKIIFDAASDTLIIEGPIVIVQGDNTRFLASSAELDSDLENGILRSARMVLDQQLQIAAAEISRVEGRYTQLYKTVASACRVCAGKVPLWEIRSEKVIHDQLKRQLYFENATLRVLGVPIMYLPRLRMPDPTQTRATGFLEPRVRRSSSLGTGIKIPYFIKFGDSADLTLTPYISPKTNTLEFRYRQAFHTGRLQFDAAVSQDELLPGATRAYLFGNGDFSLPDDFKLSFDFELTSDPAYLSSYGYSGKDRQESELTVTRTRAQDNFIADLIFFRTLRGSELSVDDQLPNFRGEVLYERRFYPGFIGGQGSWSLGLESHRRESSVDILGRDVTHLNSQLNWSRSKTFGNGMVGRVGGQLSLDTYLVQQDSSYPASLTYFTPALEAELRWPLVKSGADGASFLLEPVAHLAWAETLGSAPPNEDSTLVEFDEGNLFALSRFPGEDRFETGARATLGAKWTRYDPGGWSLGVAMGRVFRQADMGQFTNASGLDGVNSDWLLATQLKTKGRFAVTARGLFDDNFSVTKAETRASWRLKNVSLATTYSWIVPDTSENRPDLASQMTFDGNVRFLRNWTGRLGLLYDFQADKSTKTSVGLRYMNECISIDLSLSRRFSSSSSVSPNTNIGLKIKFLGFGAGKGGAPSSCSGI